MKETESILEAISSIKTESRFSVGVSQPSNWTNQAVKIRQAEYYIQSIEGQMRYKLVMFD